MQKKCPNYNTINMKKYFILVLMALIAVISSAQKVDYSVVFVQEEAAVSLTKVSSDSDYVCMPEVRRNKKGIDWMSNRILDISVDGQVIAYLSFRNNTTNIFIKDINKMGGAVQRTNRQNVLDFSYSPDGKNIAFSESVGNSNKIFVTDANKGYICRQITDNDKDYSPIYSYDMKNIYFARQEAQGASIWSYSIKDNFLSNICKGMNPCQVPKENAFFCVRPTGDGRNEIWKMNLNTGIEECIVSDANRSFTTPMLSPDGKWLLFVGSSALINGKSLYYNTDIFVCKVDGTEFTQLTYHAADDVSPVWSRDGKFIYFISQRGSSTGTANIWKMNFIFNEK